MRLILARVMLEEGQRYMHDVNCAQLGPLVGENTASGQGT